MIMMMEALVTTSPNDPYKTQPLPRLTQRLAQPVQLPLGAIAALVIVPALLSITLLVLWATTQQPASKATPLLPSPTLGVARITAQQDKGLPRAVVAYDAPDGSVIGALEQGRGYKVVARSGLAWVQLDVARAGETGNLVWVSADDVPEVQTAAGLQDLATPAPSATPQVVYVAAPAPLPALPEAPAELAPEPTSTPAYLIPPATPALRSVVFQTFPTATPCSLRQLGSSLQPCNGYQP